MSDLLASVAQGKVTSASSTTSSSTSSGNTLGKDAFLQLLVTQMKYQDPLNPSSDTEYIAQLAQFSSLEQMQNLNTTNTNSQAFNLVGKTVLVKMTTASGEERTIEGAVDYVKIENGTAKLSINGSLYTMDQVATVYDDYYKLAEGAPSVTQTALKYDKDKAEDLTVKVNMGTTSVASRLAVVVNGEAISSDYLSLSSDGTLTIKKEAFAKLPNGTHNLIFSFDDALGTVVADKVTVTISGTGSTESEDSSSDSKDDSSNTSGNQSVKATT
ncbi:flagellar basal-body rod modification protein FlgD [Lachnospiraceae bacterium KM106-2]|nr:flagellar basal-body rod modification protein FlgD [Lachnospiraceae bacterium KM106-2]